MANDAAGGNGGEKAAVASISKAIAILRLLGSAHAPLTMTEIARGTSLTPSSCHDLVTTLVRIGFVQASSLSKSYELGVRVVKLAKRALHPTAQFHDMQRSMNLISDKYDINLSIYQPFGRQSYLSTNVSEGIAPIRIRLSPGQEHLLFHGAAGRIFAAYSTLDADEFGERLRQIGISDAPAAAAFRKMAADDRARGWSEDHGVAQRGIATIAVPVLVDGDRLLGVIALMMFQRQYDQAPIAAIVRDAAALAEDVARALARRA